MYTLSYVELRGAIREGQRLANSWTLAADDRIWVAEQALKDRRSESVTKELREVMSNSYFPSAVEIASIIRAVRKAAEMPAL